MSYAQTTQKDDADYLTALYNQNKTGRYLLAGSRIGQITTSPTATSLLSCTALNAGTYQSPDTYQFVPSSGPGGLSRAYVAATIGAPFLLNVPILAATLTLPTGSVVNDGYTLTPTTVLQTFETDRSYMFECNMTIQCNVGFPTAEMSVSILFAGDVIGRASVIQEGGAANFQRGVSVKGFTNGASPASAFSVQIQSVNGPTFDVTFGQIRVSLTVF
jgi:hypothetical protein